MTVQWVFALSFGRTWVRTSRKGAQVHLDVDAAMARTIASETRKVMLAFAGQASRSKSAPVRIPVFCLHAPQLGEFGHITDVRVRNTGEKRGIWLRVEWNDRYEPNAFSHVSVGLDHRFTVQSGTTYGPCITELSLCSVPKDQRLGRLADTRDVKLSANTIQLATEDIVEDEQIEQIIALLEQALEPIRTSQDLIAEALTELLAAIGAAGEEPGDEEEPGEEESLAIGQLRQELANMREQAARLARTVKGLERGTDGGIPTRLTGSIADRQADLKKRGIKGKANILAALKSAAKG